MKPSWRAPAIAAAVSAILGSRAAAQNPQTSSEGPSFTSIGTYAIAFPVGDTHRFVPNVSWFGAGWEGQWLVRPYTAAGAAITVNDFFDATHGTTTFPSGAATGFQNRELLVVTVMGTGRWNPHHLLGRGGWLGLGAGGEYVQQNYQLGVNSSFARNGMHFVLAPDIGVTTPIFDDVDLVFSARYTGATAAGSYLGGGSRRFGFVTFSIGMSEH